MDCEQAKHEMRQGGASGALRDHLVACSECRSEQRRGQESLLQSIRAEIAAGTASKGAELPTFRRRAILLALATLVVAVQIPLLRGDWSTYPGLRMAAVLAWLAGVAIWSGLFAIRPVDRQPRPSDRWVGALALLAPAIVAWLPAPYHALVHHPEHVLEGWSQFTARTVACAAYGSVMGLPLLALLLWVRREYERGGGGFLLIAGCAGLIGNVALQLHCPILDPWHILLGHAIVPWLFASAWMLWARRA